MKTVEQGKISAEAEDLGTEQKAGIDIMKHRLWVYDYYCSL